MEPFRYFSSSSVDVSYCFTKRKLSLSFNRNEWIFSRNFHHQTYRANRSEGKKVRERKRKAIIHYTVIIVQTEGRFCIISMNFLSRRKREKFSLWDPWGSQRTAEEWRNKDFSSRMLHSIFSHSKSREEQNGGHKLDLNSKTSQRYLSNSNCGALKQANQHKLRLKVFLHISFFPITLTFCDE